MNMLSNEKVNFKRLEENIFKEMMKLGREIIQEELRMLDKLILDYRDDDENTHYNNYMLFLKLIILIIIKINDELCAKEEIKKNKNIK